jgi:hypothetical protein
MNAFEVVTFVVAVLALAIAVLLYLRLQGVLSQLGRRGGNWFDHAGDMPLEEQPSEDAVDAPIPKRPLRGRPE